MRIVGWWHWPGSARARLGSLQRSPDPLAELKGNRRLWREESEGNERGKEGRGEGNEGPPISEVR